MARGADGARDGGAILDLLLAHPVLAPIATDADALAIARAAAAAGKPPELVALALGQLAAKVVAGVVAPTLRAAVGFVVNVQPERRGPGLARCGTEERAPMRYRRLDLEPAEVAPPLRVTGAGARGVLAAIGA